MFEWWLYSDFSILMPEWDNSCLPVTKNYVNIFVLFEDLIELLYLSTWNDRMAYADRKNHNSVIRKVLQSLTNH